MLASIVRVLALALMLTLLAASRVLPFGESDPVPRESLGGPSVPLSSSPVAPRG